MAVSFSYTHAHPHPQKTPLSPPNPIRTTELWHSLHKTHGNLSALNKLTCHTPPPPPPPPTNQKQNKTTCACTEHYFLPTSIEVNHKRKARTHRSSVYLQRDQPAVLTGQFIQLFLPHDVAYLLVIEHQVYIPVTHTHTFLL